jgi:hypothetical protein
MGGAPALGGLIYLSETKLFGVARSLGISTASTQLEMSAEATGRLSLPVTPGTGLSAQARVHAERADPQAREQALEKLLAKVVRAIEREGVADLDNGSGRITEAGWFRFHRALRFGIGADDNRHSVRALVLVDREPVGEDGLVPGLLMTGSPTHLRPPYYSDQLCRAPGARSGSGSGVLFIWLHDVNRIRESAPTASIDELRERLEPRPRERMNAARTLYGLFSQEDWMSDPHFPDIVNHSPCEGLAQASLIATDDTLTVVMASPLFVRVRALPEPPGEEPQNAARQGQGKLLSLLSRKRSTRHVEHSAEIEQSAEDRQPTLPAQPPR